MQKRRTLQELTLKDNFLFAAVMMEQDNCKQLLELALGIEIEHVEINTEKSIVYHPEYKGVRLDVFARDERNTRFKLNREMGERFMLFEEMMRNERAEGKVEGKAEAILEILEARGEISESLRSRIMSEKDSSVLRQLLKYADQATTISEFDSMMNL